MTTTAATSPRWPTRVAKTGSFSGFIAIALLLGAGPAYRLGVLPLLPALLVAALGFLLFIIAFLVGGIGLLAERGRSLRSSRVSVAIVLLAGVATLFAGSWIVRLRSAPPIHDITTDSADPPAFQDIVPLRQAAQAVNPADYQRTQHVRGQDIDVAEAQRKAYPDVQPLMLPQAPGEAQKLAEQAAQELGWQIVAAVLTTPTEGRIEATDTTGYFGFQDDVVIRVRSDATGSRVDARSVSRVGVGDAGTNARRIEKYMTQLRGLAGMQ
jgi:uncharacterized protein (DUF1499 family)